MAKKIVPFKSGSDGTKGVNPDEVTSVERHDYGGRWSVIRTSDGQRIKVEGSPDQVIEELNRP